MPMFVGALLVRLYLPASGSLKDKRQVVKSLAARLSHQFGVSVAEVGELSSWTVAELGVSYVTNQASHGERILDAVLDYIEKTRPDVEVSEAARDISSPFD
jgi:uncharacterized protein YlxP (DUF503 family)